MKNYMRIVIQTPYGKYYGKVEEYSEKAYEQAYDANPQMMIDLLREQVADMRITDEERQAIALAKSRLGTSDGDWRADDVLAALLERTK